MSLFELERFIDLDRDIPSQREVIGGEVVGIMASTREGACSQKVIPGLSETGGASDARLRIDHIILFQSVFIDSFAFFSTVDWVLSIGSAMREGLLRRSKRALSVLDSRFPVTTLDQICESACSVRSVDTFDDTVGVDSAVGAGVGSTESGMMLLSRNETEESDEDGVSAAIGVLIFSAEDEISPQISKDISHPISKSTDDSTEISGVVVISGACHISRAISFSAIFGLSTSRASFSSFLSASKRETSESSLGGSFFESSFCHHPVPSSPFPEETEGSTMTWTTSFE